MRIRIEDLLQQIGELPPIPQAAQKALGLIRDPKSNMADIANVLSMDQVMTSLVLRWANSAYYGLTRPVSTVQQAITFLGQNVIQSLILAASVATLLDRPLPGYALERGDLWKHSLGVASGARLVMIKARMSPAIAEEAYHAGLLCDIGKLAFEMFLRGVDTRVEDWQGHSFIELEANYFGLDHASVGAEMASRWNLPESLQAAIRYHHTPSRAGSHIRLASAVHIADAAMMMLGIGVGKDGLQYPCDEHAFTLLGMDDARLSSLFDEVDQVIREAESFIGLTRK